MATLQEKTEAFRRENGLTKTEMASRLGLARSSYWKFMNGETGLSGANMERLLALLNENAPPQPQQRRSSGIAAVASTLRSVADTLESDSPSSLKKGLFAQMLLAYVEDLDELKRLIEDDEPKGESP